MAGYMLWNLRLRNKSTNTPTHTPSYAKPAGPNDPAVETAVRAKLAAKISQRGADLETLLKARDPDGSREIPVKAFSECLRSWDSSGPGGGRGEEASEGAGSEALTHADRKVLYRRWAVKGWVRYDSFLADNGYYDDQLPRYSDVSTAIPAAVAAAAGSAAAADAAPAPSEGKRGTRFSLGRGGSGAADKGERRKGGEEGDTELMAKTRVVLVHLSEVCLLQNLRRTEVAFSAQ